VRHAAAGRAERPGHGTPWRDAGSERRRARGARRLTMFMQVGFGAVLIVLAMLLLSAFRILREYERGVVFQLGRFWQVKGRG
jgi:SPFH domain, Band 7 family protein